MPGQNTGRKESRKEGGREGRQRTEKSKNRKEGGTDLIPGPERSSGGGNGTPLQCSCLENLHGQRSLVANTGDPAALIR